MKLLKILGAVGASLIFIVAFTTAQATSTNVVLNLEGNPTCSSLGDNSAVIEFRDGNPDSTPGIKKTALLNISGGTQLLEYTVFTTTNPPTMEWAITEVNGNSVIGNEAQQAAFFLGVNAINYIILKAQGGNKGARVFHFGAAADGDGAIADEDEEAPGSTLAAASFCYGLTTGFNLPGPPPIDLADIPTCEEIDNDLFTTGITCPTIPGAEEQLIINMALNKPQFGFSLEDGDIRACTCNTQLKVCNPELGAQRVDDMGKYVDAATGQLFVDQNGGLIDNGNGPGITADDLSQQQRTCLEFSSDGTGVPTGVNERVPFHIEGVENPDSYVCYTIGGVRTCYGHY